MSTYKERYEERKKKRESQEGGSSYKDRYLARKVASGELDIQSIGKEISERVNTWMKNNQIYISNANNRFSATNPSYRADTSDWLSTVTTQKNNFDAEAENIKTLLNQYKSFFNEDYVKAVTETLDGNLKIQENVISNSTMDYEFWSQFDSEDTYNAWLAEYKKDEAYKEFLNNVDMDKASQGWEQYLIDDEKDQEKYLTGGDDEKWYETLGRWLGSGGVTDTSLPMGTTSQAIHSTRDDANGYQSYRRPKPDWTEEQRNKFGELYHIAPEAAFVFGEETNERNAKAKEEAALKAIAESATSSVGAGAVHTAGAILSSPLHGADFLSALVYANGGREIPDYDGLVSPFEYSQAVTGGISANLNEMGGTLNEDIPIIGGKGWGDVYGLGVSTAQVQRQV